MLSLSSAKPGSSVSSGKRVGVEEEEGLDCVVCGVVVDARREVLRWRDWLGGWCGGVSMMECACGSTREQLCFNCIVLLECLELGGCCTARAVK